MNTGGPIIAMDSALRLLIQEQLLIPSNAEDQVQISFAEPTQDFVAQLSRLTINLHLFRLEENVQRRQSETMPVRAVQNNQRLEGRRPRLVDLNYMVTVWNASDQPDTEAEHRVLGQMIQALGQYQMMPTETLNAVSFDDCGFGVQFTLLEQHGSQRSDGEYWSALGSHPKPTLNIRLTVPVDVFDATFVPQIISARSTLHNGDQTEAGPATFVSLYGKLDVSNLDNPSEPLEVWARSQNGQIFIAETGSFNNYQFLNLESQTYQIAVYDASGMRRSVWEQRFIPLDAQGHAILTESVDFIVTAN